MPPNGLIACEIAVPAGIALHHAILPIMGNGAQQYLLPPAIYNVYNPAELALLALTGPAIAVVSALGPASWAALILRRIALRAE